MSELPYDVETIRALAALLAESDLSEIEIAGTKGHIRLARQRTAPSAVPTPSTAGAPAAVAVAPAAAKAAATGEAEPQGAVKSPMVGIVYLAPEPGAPPFVTAGQAVTEGQTLLLIEAMKTFNQIKAPRAGTVTKILVAAGAPVEYGEPLLILE